MENTNNTQKKAIIAVVIIIIVLGVIAVVLYKTKNKTMHESVPTTAQTDDALSAPNGNNQTAAIKPSNTDGSVAATAENTAASPEVVAMTFITKAKLEFNYPKDYTFNEQAQGNANTACSAQGLDSAGAKCYTILPNKGSELITFTGHGQTETMDVITSDTSGYKADACQSMTGTSAPTLTVSGKQVAHTISGNSEEYCLVTPDYTFTLYRNVSGAEQIDVSKIFFP